MKATTRIAIDLFKAQMSEISKDDVKEYLDITLEIMPIALDRFGVILDATVEHITEHKAQWGALVAAIKDLSEKGSKSVEDIVSGVVDDDSSKTSEKSEADSE